MDDPTNNTQTPNAPQTPQLEVPLDLTPDGDSDGDLGGDDFLQSLFSLGGEAQEETEEPPSGEPTSLAPKPPEGPEKTAEARTAIERARQRYEQRLSARKEKDELSQLREERDEYKKKLELPPDPNAIKKAAEDFLARGKTPEQQKAEQREREFEELKQWKLDQENAKQKQLAAAERAEDVKLVSDELAKYEDQYTYLSASPIKPEVLHENVEMFLASGQAKSIEEAFSILDGWAAQYANSFKKNPRALKKMYTEDPEAQTALLDVLTEMGVVNSRNRSAVRRAIQDAPATLSNELKGDFNPSNEERPLTADQTRKRMIAHAERMAREGQL